MPCDSRKPAINGYQLAHDISWQNHRLTKPCPATTEIAGVNSGRVMLRLGSQLS